MTPLVDVVFQLLIFFLLTSTYVKDSQSSSAAVPVELPESSLSAEQAPPEAIVLSINDQGALFFEGEEVTFEGLSVALERVARKNPKTILLVRGDQRVPYGRVGAVMSLARSFGLRVSAILQSGE
jgi:biopolymer transport protein TolR